MEIVASLSGKEAPIKSDKAVRNAWQAYTALADKYNEPGRFTAIIGFEWTAIGGDNLHRNVLFRGNSSIANRTVPYSQFDSQNPEATAAAVAAIVKLSPTLPPKVLDQARFTLMSLGANAEADQLAGLRYASAR